MAGEDRFHIKGLGPGDIALLRNVADEAAGNAVKRTFVAMGLDPEEPLVAQEIFAGLRKMFDDKHLPADMAWVRKSRKLSQGMIGKAVMTTIGAGVLGLIHAAWTGAQSLIGNGAQPPHP